MQYFVHPPDATPSYYSKIKKGRRSGKPLSVASYLFSLYLEKERLNLIIRRKAWIKIFQKKCLTKKEIISKFKNNGKN